VTLGLGFGFKYVWYKNNSTLYAPIYADVRVFPLTGKVTPYINLKLGYSFGYSSRFDPEVQGLGLMIDPSFGVTIKNGSKSSMNFGLGFWIQKYNETDLTDNFLHLDFGIGF
jgi:hypothetical protein